MVNANGEIYITSSTVSPNISNEIRRPRWPVKNKFMNLIEKDSRKHKMFYHK